MAVLDQVREMMKYTKVSYENSKYYSLGLWVMYPKSFCWESGCECAEQNVPAEQFSMTKLADFPIFLMFSQVPLLISCINIEIIARFYQKQPYFEQKNCLYVDIILTFLIVQIAS